MHKNPIVPLRSVTRAPSSPYREHHLLLRPYAILFLLIFPVCSRNRILQNPIRARAYGAPSGGPVTALKYLFSSAYGVWYGWMSIWKGLPVEFDESSDCFSSVRFPPSLESIYISAWGPFVKASLVRIRRVIWQSTKGLASSSNRLEDWTSAQRRLQRYQDAEVGRATFLS